METLPKPLQNQSHQGQSMSHPKRQRTQEIESWNLPSHYHGLLSQTDNFLWLSLQAHSPEDRRQS